MKVLSKFSFLILVFTIFFGEIHLCAQSLVLDGTVIGTETKSILLLKPGQALRFDSIIEIPVHDGKFHYEATLQYPEAVDLIFSEIRSKGKGRNMTLFLENVPIRLTLYSEDNFDKNSVEGGLLNAAYQKYSKEMKAKFDYRFQAIEDSMRVLYENGELYTDAMLDIVSKLESKDIPSEDRKALYQQLEHLQKTGANLTPKAKLLKEREDTINKEVRAMRQAYIERNPNLVSYSFFLKDLIYYKELVNITQAKKNYDLLSKAHPNHPYNILAAKLLKSIEDVGVGKKFVDFTAPDMNGNSVKLSEVITGKVALLDLWATWCGSCIARSRGMLPVYNEYKDRGFIIVGVAGEFENTDRLTHFFEKEKWPWLNLVELDRENKIWMKYGLDNSGGGIFLIDENGIILAKNPTPDEVRKILDEKLK